MKTKTAEKPVEPGANDQRKRGIDWDALGGAIPGFDCVKMKQAGAELVMAATAGMTLFEELAYWEKRAQERLARQAKLRTELEAAKN